MLVCHGLLYKTEGDCLLMDLNNLTTIEEVIGAPEAALEFRCQIWDKGFWLKGYVEVADDGYGNSDCAEIRGIAG